MQPWIVETISSEFQKFEKIWKPEQRYEQDKQKYIDCILKILSVFKEMKWLFPLYKENNL